MQLHGIHHLTAVTANARGNHAFFTQTLGMRLVKKTVNQDDVSAYHLFYADGQGTPGTDITFFDWPAAPERRGTQSIVRTGLRVAGRESVGYWADRHGRSTLDFEDPEGQRLSLVADDRPGEPHPWAKSPVPAAHQIRGLGPITISVRDLSPTDHILTQVMGMRRVRDYADKATDRSAGQTVIHVYEMGYGGPAA